jgi:hypothetical protein
MLRLGVIARVGGCFVRRWRGVVGVLIKGINREMGRWWR